MVSRRSVRTDGSDKRRHLEHLNECNSQAKTGMLPRGGLQKSLDVAWRDLPDLCPGTSANHPRPRRSVAKVVDRDLPRVHEDRADHPTWP